MPPGLGAGPLAVLGACGGSTLPACCCCSLVRPGGRGDSIGGCVGGGVLVWRCSGILLVLELALNDLGHHQQQLLQQCPHLVLFQYPFGP